MLDVKLLRENPDVIRNDLRRRGWNDMRVLTRSRTLPLQTSEPRSSNTSGMKHSS